MKRLDYVLLIGSPRLKKSASFSVGQYLLQHLSKTGKTSSTFFSDAIVASEDKLAELTQAIDQAEAVIIAFPLYVDHIPAALLRVLDYVSQQRQQANTKPACLAIINCGFPENLQNQSAAEVMGHFARVSRLNWMGALTFGQGGAAGGGKPLEKLGGIVRHQRRALELAAAEILAGLPLSPATIAEMAQKMMPNWFYFWTANFGFRKAARGFKVSKTINAQPYVS